MPRFPLFDHIPSDKRLTAINDLSLWQKAHHPGRELAVSIAIKNKTWPAEPEQPELEIPVHTGMSESELEKFISESPKDQERVE